jgi:hypothetical protein
MEDSTSLNNPFDILQKMFWDPMSSCFAEGAIDVNEIDKDTKKWIGDDATWSRLEYEGDEDDEVTLNGFENLEESHHMGRDLSSEQRSSNIPVLRELPSFGSTLTGRSSSTGSSRYAASNAMSRTTFSTDESILLTENETKLPNINTIRPPINPALIQKY